MQALPIFLNSETSLRISTGTLYLYWSYYDFFHSSSFTSICNPVGYNRLRTFLLICSSLVLSPLFGPLLLFLAAVVALLATFGLTPPEFIQAGLHQLGRSSAPILTPFLLLCFPL